MYDGQDMVGMSNEDMWKQDEFKNGDAIVAVAEDGTAKLITLLTSEQWKEQAIAEYDDLGEHEFNDTIPGLYYANMTAGGCPPQGHHYGCEGDCFYVEWELVKPLYPIIMNGYISLIVNSYDFNRNVFSATTDKYELVEFDPFGGCAIEQTDEEYFTQAIAPTIVGHKFVVKSLNPLPSELIFTTWKDLRQPIITDKTDLEVE